MLSETSTATVRATLPAVSGAVGEISSLFYDKLFAAHPELLRDLFNRGNQANGSQQQALADGAPIPAFRPGQYVSVQVELPDSGRQIGQCSLVVRLDGGLTFSVKRIAAAGADPAGEVSNHLHDTAHEGTALRISAPAGEGLRPQVAVLARKPRIEEVRRLDHVVIHADDPGQVRAIALVVGHVCHSQPLAETSA